MSIASTEPGLAARAAVRMSGTAADDEGAASSATASPRRPRSAWRLVDSANRPLRMRLRFASSAGNLAISSRKSSAFSSSAALGTTVLTVVACGSPETSAIAPTTSPRRSFPTSRPSAKTERERASGVLAIEASSLAKPPTITNMLCPGRPSPTSRLLAGSSRKRIEAATATSSSGCRPSSSGMPSSAATGTATPSNEVTFLIGHSPGLGRRLGGQRHPVRLARGQEGQLVDHPDRVGQLVAGDPRTCEAQQLARVELVPRSRHHERGQGLPHALVRDADHHRLGHTGVAEQEALHLGREDVEAAHVDDLLGPARDPDVPLIVDRAQVTGAKPVPVEGLRRLPGWSR